MVRLTVYLRKPEIPVGKSYGSRHSAWEASEEAVFCDEVIFLLFLVCSADLGIVWSGSSSHHVKFYSFVFMHRISTRVVCVNCKHP